MTVAVQVNDAVVESIFGEVGPLAAFITTVMETVVLPEAVDALSVPAIRFTSNRLSDAALSGPANLGEGSDTIRNTWAPNPPPGPPYLRTGDMVASLGMRAPIQEGKWLTAYGTASATHGGYLYSEILRGRGYQFFPLGDPRFTYLGGSGTDS